MNRFVTVVGIVEPYVWVIGNFYKRRTRSRIARFTKAFTYIGNPNDR